jgi:dipeptidase E
MRVLLGSGGFRTPERIAILAGEIKAHFGAIRRILFVPYALADHDACLQLVLDRGLAAGYELDGLHRHADPGRAVREAEAVFVGGGNTFRLVTELYRHGLVELLRDRVLAGLPYLGVSAGANVAGPTLKTTNDMPIVMPPSFDTLGLVPFQLNPHYFTGQTHVRVGDEFHEHFGETRDDRIREFHELNSAPVVGLWEAGVLACDGTHVELRHTPARIFRRGLPPVDVQPVARLDEWLK